MADSICLNCDFKKICRHGVEQPSENIRITGCRWFTSKKPPTNADRIRAMSNEELAEWIWRYRLCHHEKCPYPEGAEDECIRCTFDWLKQEVEHGEGN